MINENFVKEKLKEYHIKLGLPILDYVSPLANTQFPGEFNVSGFHNEVQELAEKENSFWGIDTCLRLKDNANKSHSFLFEMGIFAKSVDLQQNFIEPFKDERFTKFQEEIISQFVELMRKLGIKPENLEATYLGNLTFGSSAKGRDKILLSKYSFPEDENSKKFLEEYGIKCFPVNSLQNLDIHPLDGSLVGPRVEIAYNGMEIATLVFDCFKIKDKKLIPIHYVGGYAIGIERLIATLNDNKDFLSSIPRYKRAFDLLKKIAPATESSLLKEDVYTVIFGAEVLVKKFNDLSKGQKELLRQLRMKFRNACQNLGLNENSRNELIGHFENENSDYRI